MLRCSFRNPAAFRKRKNAVTLSFSILTFGISCKISGNIMSRQIRIDYSKDRKKSKKKLNYA
ncbi:putative lipoprotein [Leptospira santarosai str. HAI134]|nr:putative lipoprotein [Leptospira santarosai str. HAI134]